MRFKCLHGERVVSGWLWSRLHPMGSYQWMAHTWARCQDCKWTLSGHFFFLYRIRVLLFQWHGLIFLWEISIATSGSGRFFQERLALYLRAPNVITENLRSTAGTWCSLSPNANVINGSQEKGNSGIFCGTIVKGMIPDPSQWRPRPGRCGFWAFVTRQSGQYK